MVAAAAGTRPAAVDTDDLEVLRRFEDCTLPEAEWTHLAHVRVAWTCLALEDPAAALERIRRGIRRYNAQVLGRPERYHDTVTVAFTRLVQARMRDAEPWSAFSGRIDDLLDPRRPILGRYYSVGLLASERARLAYVPPDLASLPGTGRATGR